MTTNEWVYEVEEQTFHQTVVEASKERPIVIDFWAEWCGPCRALTPMLEKLVEEMDGRVALAKINVDANQMLAGQFRISSIPAIRVLHNEELVDGFDGVRSEPELRGFLERIADQAGSSTGQEAIPDLPPEEAEAKYRKQLEEDPNSDEAMVGLLEALIAQDKRDEAEQLLEKVAVEGDLAVRVDRAGAILFFRHKADTLDDESTLRQRLEANPKDATTLYQLGCTLANEGQCEPALEALLTSAENDFTLAGGDVREAMVKVFYILGSDHELANAYRAKLAPLLY